MEIFKLYGSIFVDADQAKKSISDTAKNAKDLGSKLEKTGSNISKFGAGITKGVTAVTGAVVGIGAGLTAMATKSASVADEIDKMSQKIGISRESYQELDYVLSQNGMDVNQLQGGMKALVNTMQSAQQGSKSATATFEQLGVSVMDVNGDLRKQEDVFYDAISALQEMENETERNALANDIFGRSAVELIPLLNSGAGSMEELRQKAHDLGLIMEDDAVDAGVKFTDTMDSLKRSFEMVGVQLGTAIMPYVQEFADYIIDNMPKIQEMIPKIADGIANVAKVLFGLAEKFLDADEGTQKLIAGFGAFVYAIGPVISAVGTVVGLFGKLSTLWGTIAPFVTGTLIPAFEAVATTISVTMVGAIAAVAGAIYVWIKNWDEIKEAASLFCERTVEKIEWLRDKIKSAFEAIKNFIKLPHFKIEGTFSLNPPTIPKVGVDWYAKAMNSPMIMNSPTSFGINSAGQLMAGGEAGSEVVAGTRTLQRMISDSVSNNSSNYDTILGAVTEALTNCQLQIEATLSADSNKMFNEMRVSNSQFKKQSGGKSAFA